MSILDALRVQRSGQKSVQELAQLPQQQIMQMAQMGQIPADVVPVIISEKARLAQQAAQAQAMQNPPQPSVMDQAMQVNAQHEQQGLPAIPTPGMFQEQNYQAGGIVGYAGDGAEGQQVQGYQPDEINALAERGDSGLGKYVQQALAQQRAINANPIVQSQAEKDYASMLKSPPTDENRMMWLSLLRGGLKGLAGTSPYAAVNLGQGLGEAAQSYEEGLREQQKQKLAYAKEMADQAKAQRQEGLSALTLGAKLMESQNTLDAALARAAKEGDMNTFIRIAVTAARERGDKTPEAILAEAAAQNFIKLKAAFDSRVAAAAAQGTSAQAATTQADVAGKRQRSEDETKRDEIARKREEDQRQAQENYGKRVDEAKKRIDAMIADPPTSQFRKDMRTEGVVAFRERLLREELRDIPVPMGMPRSGEAPPSSGRLPPGFRPPINPAPPPPGFNVIR
jgi:hypothetical protein